MSNAVESFYDQQTEREWQRLERHRTEFAVIMRVLLDHLPPPPAAILDVGGGPGRYAIALTRQGYHVTLCDLAQANLALAREKAAENDVQLAGYQHANALDLSRFPAATFHAVLLMGPLYHLTTAAEHRQAIREAARVLQPGGLLFAAFVGRYAPFRNAARHDPLWLVNHPERANALLATGVNRATPDSLFTDAYFAHPTEIRPLLDTAGFTTLDLVACEGIVSLIEDEVNKLDGEAWQAWVNLNYQLGRDPSIHGAAEHLLYVGKL